MALISPPPEVDSEVRAEYEEGRSRFAHFDGLRRVLTRVPAALRAADGMYELIMERGSLGRELKEAIFVACAGVRRSRYGQAAHGRWLIEHAAIDPVDVALLARGGNLPRHSPSDHALLAFARKVAAAPHRTVADDVETLHRAGFVTAEIIEALTVVSLSAWMNGYADALGLDETDAGAVS